MFSTGLVDANHNACGEGSGAFSLPDGSISYLDDLFEHQKIAITMFEPVLRQLAAAVILIDDSGAVF